MPTQICTKCGKEKPLNEFYKNGNAKNGYHASCKKCQYEQKKGNTKGSKFHKFTREELEFIVKGFTTELMEAEEIAKSLRISKANLMANVGYLRKLGVDLPKKTNGTGNRDLLRSFAEEWVLKNKKTNGKK